MIILRYILNILIAIDQFVNVLFGGSPDETISSRLGRNYPNSIMEKVVNTLFFWDKNHCASNIESDRDGDEILK